MKPIKCFRFVKEDMTSENGKCTWKLGEWNKINGKLEICETGLHACKSPLKSLGMIFGDKWFIAEAKGEIIEQDDKFCSSEMRLVKELPLKKISVEFSIACAMRCIKHYEKLNPKDDRPRKAIDAAKAYLKNPTETLRKAAEDASSAAESAAWSAESAARSAAWSAESAAWSAESAARSAARSAAWSAAWSAESAAWSAESAARSAARSAAWSAAESAAWSAESAARSAAESAELKWQEQLLNKIVRKYSK